MSIWITKCKKCNSCVHHDYQSEVIIRAAPKLKKLQIKAPPSEKVELYCSGKATGTKHKEKYKFPEDFEEVPLAGIDDNYWIDYVKKSITESRNSRDKAAERLDTFLKWLWGIYTSVFALASIFDYLSNSITQLIFIILPIILIIVARYFCTRVSMPDVNKVHANNVEEIIEEHNAILESKQKRLRWALIFTIISIVSLSVALVVYSLFDPNRDIKAEIRQLELEKEKVENSIMPLQSKVDTLKQMDLFYDLQLKIIKNKEKYDSIVQENPELAESLNATYLD